MARNPIPTWYFCLVVVRLKDRFLLVQECKHGQRWYLPAGRVEPGETFVEAAVRETLEESGIPIVVEGILRIEHTPYPDGTARVRFIFVAHPLDETPPKTTADEHSLGAAWFSLDELETLPLRGEHVHEMLEFVKNDAPIYPLKILTFEGASYKS